MGAQPGTVDEINTHHTNETYLPGAKLPDKLVATNDIGEAVRDADVIVMGIPSQNFRAVLEEVKKHIRAWVPVISLTKGLELDTRMRMTEIISEVLPGHPVGVLTGPNLAREIMAGQAAAGVIAMEDDIIVQELQNVFKSGLFRVYTNTDVIGCELGGVLKNIIAIAVGMGDGQGAGDNTRSALITRGLAEVTRLGVAMGGRAGNLRRAGGHGRHDRHLHQPPEPQPPRRGRTGQRPGHAGHHRRDGHGRRRRQKRTGGDGTGREVRCGNAYRQGCIPGAVRGRHRQPRLSRPVAGDRRRRIRTGLERHCHKVHAGALPLLVGHTLTAAVAGCIVSDTATIT